MQKEHGCFPSWCNRCCWIALQEMSRRCVQLLARLPTTGRLQPAYLSLLSNCTYSIVGTHCQNSPTIGRKERLRIRYRESSFCVLARASTKYSSLLQHTLPKSRGIIYLTPLHPTC